MRSKPPEQMSRHELADQLAASPRQSAAWREARAVCASRLERISRVGTYAAGSIVVCVLFIALITLLR